MVLRLAGGALIDFDCRLQKIYQANSESYNGAIRDNYSWSQNISDVDIRIKVNIPILFVIYLLHDDVQ